MLRFVLYIIPILIFSIFSTSIFLYNPILGSLEQTNSLSLPLHILLIVITFMTIICYGFTVKYNVGMKIMMFLTLFVIIGDFLSLLNNKFGLNNYIIIQNISYSLLWIGLVFIGYIVSNKIPEETDRVIKLIGLFIVPFLSILLLDLYNRLGSYSSGVDISFVLLMVLPSLSFVSGKKKYYLLVFASLILLLSLKRSIVLILLSVIFFNLFVFGRYSKNKIKLFFIMVLLILFCFLFLGIVNELTDGSLFLRFNNLADDGGSGRDSIYSDVLNIIYNSSELELLFGHGNFSVKYFLGVLAHNDYLELMCDFGIFALFYFVLFILYLLYNSFAIIIRKKIDYKYTLAFSISVLIFFLTGVFNCFISGIYVYPIAFQLGVYMGFINNIKHISNCKTIKAVSC